MFTGMPALSHEEQQAAVERIHTLMQEGMSSGEAIARQSYANGITAVSRSARCLMKKMTTVNNRNKYLTSVTIS